MLGTLAQLQNFFSHKFLFVFLKNTHKKRCLVFLIIEVSMWKSTYKSLEFGGKVVCYSFLEKESM